MDFQSIISGFLALIPILKDSRIKKKEETDLALRAICDALHATLQYYSTYKDGDNNIEQRKLAKLWDEASIASRNVDRSLSRLLHNKSMYHVVYGNPFKHKEEGFDISLDNVRLKFEELLNN